MTATATTTFHSPGRYEPIGTATETVWRPGESSIPQRSIVRRGFDAVNRADHFMEEFLPYQCDASSEERDGYPLEDETWTGPLLQAS
jgi:hypothetical protein